MLANQFTAFALVCQYDSTNNYYSCCIIIKQSKVMSAHEVTHMFMFVSEKLKRLRHLKFEKKK